jgi:hypothetical protein
MQSLAQLNVGYCGPNLSLGLEKKMPVSGQLERIVC